MFIYSMFLTPHQYLAESAAIHMMFTLIVYKIYRKHYTLQNIVV